MPPVDKIFIGKSDFKASIDLVNYLPTHEHLLVNLSNLL